MATVTAKQKGSTSIFTDHIRGKRECNILKGYPSPSQSVRITGRYIGSGDPTFLPQLDLLYHDKDGGRAVVGIAS